MLTERIKDRMQVVFGGYQRQKHIIGESPDEPWQDALGNLPRESLTRDHLDYALRNIFPGHDGDVDVFRYLLPRFLNMSFCDYDSDPIKFGSIREDTGLRCCQWRPQMKKVELELIEEVFWDACENDFAEKGIISPFFFNLMIAWNKEISDFERLGEGVDLALIVLKDFGKRILRAYSGLAEMSSVQALFGAYHDLDTPNSDEDSIQEWVWNAFPLGWWNIEALFTDQETKRLDKELLEFFLE